MVPSIYNCILFDRCGFDTYAGFSEILFKEHIPRADIRIHHLAHNEHEQINVQFHKGTLNHN